MAVSRKRKVMKYSFTLFSMAFQEMSTQRIVRNVVRSTRSRLMPSMPEEIAHAPFGEPRRLFDELHALRLLVEKEEERQGDGRTR